LSADQALPSGSFCGRAATQTAVRTRATTRTRKDTMM
jgi:hypothetical protein